MADFLQALHAGPLLPMDGAMGTELQRAGLAPGECYELWNLTHPEKVLAIHRAYLEAGARCLLTNTFQANPVALAQFGLADQLESINRAALQLARSAGSGDHWVIASIGPVDVQNHPEALDVTLRSLAEADAILLETWSQGFVDAVRRATDPTSNPRQIPVLLSLTFAKNPRPGEAPLLPPTGMTAREAARLVSGSRVAALGVNCGRGIGLDEILMILCEYRSQTDLALFARPNAGTPVRKVGWWIYPHSPEEMANWVEDLVGMGVRMLGGCCGTTPAHIRAFACSSRAYSAAE